MRKESVIICIFVVALFFASIQGVYAEDNIGNKDEKRLPIWEKIIELDENSEEDREFRELDRRIESEIDALDIEDKDSVTKLYYDLAEMKSFINFKANLLYKHDHTPATDERGVEQKVYRLPEKPGRAYLDGKVRCMYVYPIEYSGIGAYVYLSESGRAAVIDYDTTVAVRSRYYVVDDILLGYVRVVDDAGVSWSLPDWEADEVDEKTADLLIPEGYEGTYEFQSVIAASWIKEIRALQEQFDSCSGE
ncbi:MAG: hypothetical protein J6D53_07100 [Blautia sp.]|nr:hypothetical protein [Blautia sp.]